MNPLSATEPPTKNPNPFFKTYEKSAFTFPDATSDIVPEPVITPARPSSRFLVCIIITDVTLEPYLTLGSVMMSTLFMFSGDNWLSSLLFLTRLLFMYISGVPLPSTDIPPLVASIIGIILMASLTDGSLASGLPSISTVSPEALCFMNFLTPVTVMPSRALA